MMCRYYISTKEITNNNYVYGTLCMVNNEPFEYNCGKITGNIIEVNEKLTKMIMEKNKKNLLPTSLLFKYDSLDISKHMLYMFDHNKDFVQYSRETHIGLDSSPSIFLSDVTNLNPLKKRMETYALTLKWFDKHNNKSL